MEDLITPFVFMLIIGGVSGYLMGSLLKRVSGMALILGIFAFLVIALVYTGSIDLNFDGILSNLSNVLGIIAPLGLVALISSVPFVASFVTGIFLGYRRY